MYMYIYVYASSSIDQEVKEAKISELDFATWTWTAGGSLHPDTIEQRKLMFASWLNAVLCLCRELPPLPCCPRKCLLLAAACCLLLPSRMLAACRAACSCCCCCCPCLPAELLAKRWPAAQADSARQLLSHCVCRHAAPVLPCCLAVLLSCCVLF